MKDYVFAGGLTFDALTRNINFYAKEGYTVIPPVIVEKEGKHTAYLVLMELQISDKKEVQS